MLVNEEKRLIKACKDMRLDILRMSNSAGSAGVHFGGTFSLIETMASLYLHIMNISKDGIKSENRDRVIMSKGHGAPAMYAAMKQKGIITDDELMSFKQNTTNLYGHPCMNESIGIEYSSGSLGQGLSLAVGAALALRHKQNDSSRLFVILGDGECNEGSIWESAMAAYHYKLNSIVVIVDRNHIQYDGDTEVVLSLEPLAKKWESFGWKVIEIDGHSVSECCDAFGKKYDVPLVVIANTIKGKGVSFMEGNPVWHNNVLSEQQYNQAEEEINNATV